MNESQCISEIGEAVQARTGQCPEPHTHLDASVFDIPSPLLAFL